jgi:exodeoxyribonuclease V alpha subunit
MPEKQLELLQKILHDVRDRGLDPVWDVQVMVAVNENSQLCRLAVNEELQTLLNPTGRQGHPKLPFRWGDKVICLRNGFYQCEIHDREANVRFGQAYVANGEVGKIIEINTGFFKAEMPIPRRVVQIPLWADDSYGDKWALAYAVTVHKMQGSETPIAVVMVDEYPGAKRLCDRAWLYTAVSRAKKECYLVGQLETARQFCYVNNIGKRKTFLEELIGCQTI